MLRKPLLALALLVLSAAFARAQVTPITSGFPDSASNNFNLFPDYERPMSPADVRRNYEIEQKYRETLRTKIPDRKASNDPWKSIRSAPTAVDLHRPQ